MNNLAKKSKTAFLWDFFGKISGQLISFVISIFLARLLNPEVFGILAMINVVIALSSSFTDMGLGVALIQKEKLEDSHYSSVFYFNIISGFLLAILLFFLSEPIAKFYNNTELILVAKTMAPLFLLNSIGLVIRLKLRKELEYKVPIQSNLIASITSGIIGVIMAFSGFGVWSLVAQSLINPIIANIWLFTFVHWRPKLNFSLKALYELWHFGFRMFLSNLINTILVNVDSLIIGRLFSASTLGFFYRSKSLNNLVVQYSSDSLMSVLFPVISKLQNDKERLKLVVFKSLNLISMLSFLISGFFFIIGEDLIILLFTEKWRGSVDVFKLLIISAYAYPISALLVNIISGLGNSSAFLKLEIIKAILFSLNLIIGFYYGLEGYLYGYAFTVFLSILINIIYASHDLEVTGYWFIKIILPYFLITIPSVVFVAIFNSSISIEDRLLHLFINAALFGTIYFILSRLIKSKGLNYMLSELSKFKALERICTKLNFEVT